MIPKIPRSLKLKVGSLLTIAGLFLLFTPPFILLFGLLLNLSGGHLLVTFTITGPRDLFVYLLIFIIPIGLGVILNRKSLSKRHILPSLLLSFLVNLINTLLLFH